MSPETYVHAAGRWAPTALYDPIMTLTTRERAWRPVVVDHVVADRPATIVECRMRHGLADLADLAARAPGAQLIGVDGDPHALSRARTKLAENHTTAELGEATPTRRRWPTSPSTRSSRRCWYITSYLPTSATLSARCIAC